MNMYMYSGQVQVHVHIKHSNNSNESLNSLLILQSFYPHLKPSSTFFNRLVNSPSKSSDNKIASPVPLCGLECLSIDDSINIIP